MLRIRTMIALAVLGALAVVALAIPAMANDDNDRTDHQRSGGGLDRSSLGSGGKLTLKLLERGEAQTLAEIYASEDTGKKVERAMRRGLVVHCQPGGYDTLSFTCEGDTTTALRTVPDTTVGNATVPQTPTQLAPPSTSATASATATAR
jgi:hypothetical protein